MRIEVLDHGYVQSIEAWGQGNWCSEGGASGDYERGIIEAARQSTQKGFMGWDQDAKLLKYLHDHKHATPFEFAGMVLEVQAPIFVFREWHRHRTQSYNEMSARYAPLPDLNYIPTVERMMLSGGHLTKQAGSAHGANDLTEGVAGLFQKQWETFYARAEALYQDALAMGVPKELARVVLPVGRYSRMRASANLRNWLAFLTLRMDPAAQWEIRQYAAAVAACISATFPQTWRLVAEAA